jgi:hypothetical protein
MFRAANVPAKLAWMRGEAAKLCLALTSLRRNGSDEAIQLLIRGDHGLLRGACHRARRRRDPVARNDSSTTVVGCLTCEFAAKHWGPTRHLCVVPANAGTHNHHRSLEQKPLATLPQREAAAYGSPGPVRNCALGGDDVATIGFIRASMCKQAAINRRGFEELFRRRCEERSDEAIHTFLAAPMDCGACHRARIRATRSLAMTEPAYEPFTNTAKASA